MKKFTKKGTPLKNLVKLLFVFVLATVMLKPGVAHAGQVTINEGKTEPYTVSASGETITVTLNGAYTSVNMQGKPSWVTCTKNGSKFTVTVPKNTSTSQQKGDIVFRDGSKIWTLRITQKAAAAQTVSVRFYGSNGLITTKTYTVGSTYGSFPSAPASTGYTFDGWYTSGIGGTKISTGTTVSSSYTSLYAHYKGNTYTVYFNSNSGSSVSSKTVTYGETYGSLTTPTRTGYTFSGWFTSSSGGSSVSSSTKVTTASNHTLYAHWAQADCTITFDVNGGYGQANMTQLVVKQGNTIGSALDNRVPGAPSGKHFDGWYTATSGGTKYTGSSKAPYSSTLKLYAHWSQSVYYVAFNNNATGVTGSMSTMTCQVGSSYTLSSNTLSRTGYTFNGWNTKSDGSGTSYANGATVSNLSTTHGTTVTLFAQWKPAYCSITFDVNGGSGQANMTSMQVQQGTTIGSALDNRVPGAPENKHFVGWYTATSGGTRYTGSSTAPYASSLKLYARWEINTYTVVFNQNATGVSGTMENKTYQAGSSYTLPGSTFSLKGKVFKGWNTKSDGSGTSYADGAKVSNLTKTHGATVTLYAQWKDAICTITFDVNGGDGQSNMTQLSVSQGAVIGDSLDKRVPGAPTNQHFVGWYTATSGGTKYTGSSTAPYASSLKLYAHWEINTYTVVFNQNATGVSGTMENKTYQVGSSYNLPGSTFSLKGKVFDGWNTKSDGSGKSYANGAKVSNLTKTHGATVTLYAQWKDAICTITFDVNGGDGQSNMTQLSVSQGAVIGDSLDKRVPGAPANQHFVGWYTSTSGGTKYTGSSKAPYTSTLKLYAHWEASSYTVVFNQNATGVSGTMENKTYLVGSSYNLPTSTFTLKGKVFAGWNTKSDGSGTSYDDAAKVSNLSQTHGATVTLYAQWKDAICTITFDVNGGLGQSNMTSLSVRQGAVIGDSLDKRVPGAPSNQHFVGWFSSKVSGKQYTGKTKAPYSTTLKLYARWEPDSYTIVFSQNAVGVSGTMENMTCLVGSSYNLTASTFSLKGKVFKGWNTKSDGSGTSYADGAKIADLTKTHGATVILYAQWKDAICTITFDVNGGFGQANMTSISVPQGAVIGDVLDKRIPGAPQGMAFVGWYSSKTSGKLYTSKTKAPYSSTLTLYARWEPFSYTLAFDSNATIAEGTMDSITCYIDSSFNLPRNTFSLRDYTFDGWNTAADGSGTSYANGAKILSALTTTHGATVTLYAQWKSKPTVTSFKYTSDGNMVSCPWDYTIDFSHFFKSSYTDQHDLMLASLETAMAAFDTREVDDSNKGYENIMSLMKKLKFENRKYSYPTPGYDTIGYAIGSRQIYDAKTKKTATLILVAIRGAGYGDEWGGNFRVYNPNGSNLNHYGFELAANQVLKGLNTYMTNNKDSFESIVKVWVVGYSRAAATSNLVCSKIIKKSYSLPISISNENVFGFGFETPRCTTDSSCHGTQFNGIKSLINPIDFVPMVAMNNGDGWNYDRYGKTFLIPAGNSSAKSTMEDKYKELLNAYGKGSQIKKRLKEYTNSSHSSQHDFLTDVFKNLADNTGTPKDYYDKGVQDLLIPILAAVLTKGDTDWGTDYNSLKQHLSSVVSWADVTYAEKIFKSSGLANMLTHISTIKYSHYPELCLSWLATCESFEQLK